MLGPLEEMVMDFLWDNGPSTVAEVHAGLKGRRDLAYTTVLTILGRLAKKGLLVRTLVGNSHVYSTALSRDEFAGNIVEGVLDGLLEAFSQPALAYFAQRLRQKDEVFLKELERLLAERAEEEEG